MAGITFTVVLPVSLPSPLSPPLLSLLLLALLCLDLISFTSKATKLKLAATHGFCSTAVGETDEGKSEGESERQRERERERTEERFSFLKLKTNWLRTQELPKLGVQLI